MWPVFFSVVKSTFFLPPPFHSKYENKHLHCISQILHAESFDTKLIIRVKSFFKT